MTGLGRGVHVGGLGALKALPVGLQDAIEQLIVALERTAPPAHPEVLPGLCAREPAGLVQLA
jgi:hypothetical protein